MRRRHLTGGLILGTLALSAVVFVFVGASALSQEKAPEAAPAKVAQPAEAAEPAPADRASARRKKPRGRVPSYYGGVVDQQQREKIYAIQQEYAPKIDPLKAQLAALTKERDEKIAGVLTPEQLKKVEELREAARAKRSGGKQPQSPKPKAEKAAGKPAVTD